MFSEAQYNEVIDEIKRGLAELEHQMGRIGPAVEQTCALLPEMVAHHLVRQGQQLYDICAEVLSKIWDFLQGAAAPVTFFFRAYDWQADVGGASSAVAAATAPNALRATLDWTGDAANAYTRAVSTQTVAAAEIQSIANQMATSLTACAVGGLAFYGAMALLLAKLIPATIAAVAAFGTAVLSPVGIAIILEEAAVDTAVIITAVTALTALLGVQASQMVAIKAAAAAQDAFPGGAWPSGQA